MEQLGPNLWRHHDTAAVYLIRQGDRGLLINLGAGEVLDRLDEASVAQVDWLLFTHAHRTVCQGFRKAIAKRIPVAVPEHEADLFTDAEALWRSRRPVHSRLGSTFHQAPIHDVRAARLLKDGEYFDWGQMRLRVLATPGATPGAISLIAEVDDKRIAFVGDAVSGLGRPGCLADLQYTPGGSEGVGLLIGSLDALLKQRCAMLCPAQGEPTHRVEPALMGLRDRLVEWRNRRSREPAPADLAAPPGVRRIAPNVLLKRGAANSAVILGDAGQGLFIDCGVGDRATLEALRFALPGSPNLRRPALSLSEWRDYGLTGAEAAIPTGLDDEAILHVVDLAASGAAVWAHEDLAEVLADPTRFRLPGLMGRAVKVDRVLREGESINWRGRTIVVRRLPAAGRRAVGVFAEVEGVRCAFTGDAMVSVDGSPAFLRPVLARGVPASARVRTIDRIVGERPELIVPGRGEPMRFDAESFSHLRAHATTDAELWESLCRQGDLSLDPNWATLEPYQIVARRGDEFACRVRVFNRTSARMSVRAALCMPTEFRGEPGEVEFEVEPEAEGFGEFTVLIPAQFVPLHRTQAIAADLWVDGWPAGQLAEALVTIGEVGSGKSQMGSAERGVRTAE